MLENKERQQHNFHKGDYVKALYGKKKEGIVTSIYNDEMVYVLFKYHIFSHLVAVRDLIVLRAVPLTTAESINDVYVKAAARLEEENKKADLIKAKTIYNRQIQRFWKKAEEGYSCVKIYNSCSNGDQNEWFGQSAMNDTRSPCLDALVKLFQDDGFKVTYDKSDSGYVNSIDVHWDLRRKR